MSTRAASDNTTAGNEWTSQGALTRCVTCMQRQLAAGARGASSCFVHQPHFQQLPATLPAVNNSGWLFYGQTAIAAANTGVDLGIEDTDGLHNRYKWCAQLGYASRGRHQEHEWCSVQHNKLDIDSTKAALGKPQPSTDSPKEQKWEANL